MRTSVLLCSVLGLSVAFAGCDGDVEGDEPGECSDGTDNDQDGVADCDDSGCGADAACIGGDDDDDDDSAVDPCDDIEPGPGSVEGTVVRSVPVTGDGIGTLIVSLFEGNPLSTPDTCEIARMTYEGVDLSPEMNGWAFSVGGIQLQSAAYFITAVFDDNGDFGEDGPGPGDLLVVDESGLSTPTVVVADKTVVSLDLELNYVFGAEGDDDDSSSDDDDSAGDDDDSAGR
jgi:hypothetical protein